MSAQKLGLILSCIIDFLNPERIIIGSIYSRSEKLFKTTVEEILQRETLELNRKVCSLFPCGLGENIGDYAALGVAKVNYANK
jgi:glucokinase